MTNTLKKRVFVISKWRSCSLLLVAFATGCGGSSESMPVEGTVGNSASQALDQSNSVATPAISNAPESAVDQSLVLAPAPETPTEQAPEPAPVSGVVTQQATESTPQSDLVAEQASEPAPEAELSVEQALEPSAALESMVGQTPGSTAAPDPVSEPVNQPTLEPTAAPEPAAEQLSELTAAPEPVAGQMPEPTAAPEPVAVETPEPAAEPEPVAEQTPEPATEPEPVAEQAPEPATEPEPVAEQAPEPTSEPERVTELSPEPAPAPTPLPVAADPAPDLQPLNDEGSLPAGNTASSLRTIPDQLDNLYRYNVNSISDLVTYRGPDGNLQQVLSYWSDERRLHITQRSFPSGEFSTPIDVHTAVHGGNDALEYDSHNSSAIGVAPNGVMFVTGNHHSSVLNMAKTTSAFDIGSFSHMLPGQMVASSEVDRVTYPSFFNHGRFLYFSYREQEVGQGAPRFRWLINRYDPDRDEWQKAVQFNTGIDLRLYVSSVAVPADGSSMHVFATWRDDSAGGGVESQRDYFHLYSTDGNNWKIKNSEKTVTASQHLWYDNGDRTLPGHTGIQLSRAEKIWETPGDSGPRSAGDVAVDSSGNPHSLVKNFSGSLFHHYWDGVWKSTQLAGSASQSLDMVACPSEMGALLHDQGSVSYRSLDPTHPSYNSPVLLAQGFTNSDFTISIDKEAIRLGYVSFLLTSSSHFSPNDHGSARANPQPAWVATYHCSQLEDPTVFTRN